MVDILIETNIDDVLKRFKVKEYQISGALGDAGRELEREALRLFRGTTRGWNHQPDFDSDVDITANGIDILVGTDDPVYGYLDRGTRVRRALMSTNWISKTTPNSLQTGPGRGRVIFISRRLNRPGIRARNFTKNIHKTIQRKTGPVFTKYIKRWIRK